MSHTFVEIRELLRKITKQGTISVFTAEVLSVDDKYCTVDYGSTKLTKVKNFCIDAASNIFIKPKINSMVTVLDLGGFRDMQIIKVQEFDEIIITNGNNAGLIKIIELTNKLNGLITEVKAMKQDYIAHTHPVPSLGTSSAPTVPFAGSFSNFNKSDFEDTKIKH